MPKLSILIAALESRRWNDIVDQLNEQIIKFNASAEVLVCLDNGEKTSGVKRQSLLEQATGDYICYVDDDDEVSKDYITQMVNGCNSGADVVSFNLNLFKEGRYKETWSMGCYPNSRKDGIMLINHLCAWKRTIAQRVSWCPFLGNSDDHVWSQPLFFGGLVKTCLHINTSLYHYYFQQQVTENQKGSRREFALNYFQKGIRCFYYGSEIVIEHDPRRMDKNQILVRFSDSSTRLLPIEHLTQFHTVQP